MKIIEIPLYEEDGSIKATMHIGPEEAQNLLTFAVNFLAATGQMALLHKAEANSELEDFTSDKYDA